jgi:hypothetical protein
MKGVVIKFRSVQSRADGTFDAYILCIDKLLNDLQRRFTDFEVIQFSVSFNSNPFQERDICGSIDRMYSVFE